MNARELRAKHDEVLNSMRALNDGAENENRDLNAEEQVKYDGLKTEAESLQNRIKRTESLPEILEVRKHPAVLSYPRGDSEIRALGAYFKKGDKGAVRELLSEDQDGDGIEIRMPSLYEQRATDSTMNIGTAADGGAAVPTGFSGKIAMRKGEIMLAQRLGCQIVPGQGTTVNFPYENADAAVFAATSEQADNYANTYERDVAPVIANKAFTLAKKTKKLALTEELLDDEDVNLMNYVAECIGRGLGLTHNTALLTEVAANGASLVTFASATVIADGEPEKFVYHSTASFYLDDGGSIGWVMLPAVLGEIKVLTGNPQHYGNSVSDSSKVLLGYPVEYSSLSGATAASTKSVYFGNWWYVGYRENPALRIIRDPYTTDGIVYLKYATRLCYGVLIAGAIGYGVHPSA